MSEVLIQNGAILIDGKKTQIVSGTIHYFRIHKDQWRDRLAKAKAFGCNAIETYMCWNLHEPEVGKFNFAGNLDIAEFLREIQEIGLHAIVRPGPFICAEWENGGFPAFLMREKGMRLRCMDARYLAHCERFLKRTFDELIPLQYAQGGPIIAIQLENEYGSYACDHEYIEHLRKFHIDNGITVPLFTSDGPSDTCLQGGTVPGVFQTVNFGSHAKDAFRKGREYRADGPDFCMEFWNGWFDHWGEKHHVRRASDAARELDDMLGSGASVNFYVFCGGTNFNFWNGANGNGLKADDYAPTVTSYDYDAPLSECGDATEKFYKCREIIRKYLPDVSTEEIPEVAKVAYAPAKLTESAKLFANLDHIGTRHRSIMPELMEDLGQSFGFINYRVHVEGPKPGVAVRLFDMRDRATVYQDGKYIGTIHRNDAPDKSLPLDVPASGCELDVLVENTGRINYGPRVGRDSKGIEGGIGIGLQFQIGVDTWCLPMDRFGGLEFGDFDAEEETPAFHRGSFEVGEIADTFIKFPGVKGVVWVNGFNIGRYWNVGPGNTLYVPAPILKRGTNEVIVFELHKLKKNKIEFSAKPRLK